MISPNDFFKINRIDSLKSDKVLAIHRPRTRDTRAKLLNGIVYCSSCGKTLTSMVVDKRDKSTKDITSSRYYYKCETESCPEYGKSARAGLVVNAAQDFFEQYLFVTKRNYAEYVKTAKKEVKRQAKLLDSSISRLKVLVSNKKESYQKTKELVLSDPDLQKHYNLDDYLKEIDALKSEYETAKASRANLGKSVATLEEYLKLFETIPVILGKIRDMETMDTLIRIFFSNFIIHPATKGTFKGATVSYELKEPWKGFVDNGDFVRGAGTGTLTRDLFLGKEAL